MGTGITITVGGNDITAYCKVETLRIEEVGTQDVATAYFRVEDHSGTVGISGKDSVDIRPTGGAEATILFAGEVGRLDKGQRGVTKTWEVNCQDNNVLLDERTIPSASYAAATADSAIIDDLFTNYRSDINSTDEVDTINASMEAIEFEEMTLRECLDAICAITGGRYYVDYQKKLHYFNVETGNTASFGLSTSPDFSSIYPFSSFRKVEDSTRLTTHVRVVGEDAEGWYPATPDYSSDERHALVRDRSAVNAAAVEDVGTAVYNRYNSDRETYRLSTEQDGLRAGQSVGLVNATWGISSTFWIRELKMVVLDKAGDKRRYDLVLNDEAPSPARMARQRQMDTSAQVEVDITLSARGWGHDLTFSASDDDTIAWASGTITLADGHTTYSIDAGNTGNMANLTYIYLDVDTSLMVLQTTTTAATAIGKNKILIAVAAPSGEAGKDATFQVFGGKGVGVFITADNIAANTITANEISANTITAAEIAADTITAAEIAAATITGTEIAAAAVTADKLSIGAQIFDVSNGQLLLNPPLKILQEGSGASTANYWYGKRGQKCQVGAAAAAYASRGSLHLVPGRWPQTSALMIEEGSTNYVSNPSFESATTGWSTLNSATLARSDDEARFGDYSGKVVTNGAGNYEGIQYQSIAVTASQTHIMSLWLKGPVGETVQLALRGYTAGDVHVSSSYSAKTMTGQWEHYSLSHDFGATEVKARIVTWSGAQTIAYTFYVDGVMLEKNQACATSYVDGDQGEGYSWSGTAHASTSSRTKSYILLDDYVELVDSVPILSFRFVVQAPYDYDAEWPGGGYAQYLMDARDSGDATNTYLSIRFNETGNQFTVKVGSNTTVLASGEYEFYAGDWLDIVVTLDFTNDQYHMYIDGVEVDSALTMLSASAHDSWNLGSHYTEINQSGWAFSEFAVFDRVITSVEVAQLYNLGRPLVDTGGTDVPGIYILDGMFRIASQQTGNRIELTPDEIAGYDDTGTKQFYLQASDGKAACGGGVLELDSDGVDIAISTAAVDTRAYKFNLSGTVMSGLWAYAADAYSHVINLQANSVTSRASTIGIYSNAPAISPAYVSIKSLSGASDYAQIILEADSDAAVKTKIRAYAARTEFSGTISTDASVNRWKLKGAAAASIYSTLGYVEIEINGTTYRLLYGTFT